MKHNAAEMTLLGCCLSAMVATLLIGARWPLVGDSVLMHYVVLLMHHGFAPYRDIAEMWEEGSPHPVCLAVAGGTVAGASIAMLLPFCSCCTSAHSQASCRKCTA